MPSPKRGNGKTSSLRSALSHPDPAVRDAYIEQIAEYYGEVQTIKETAEKFQCGHRTLERAMADFPKLGEAIERIRNRIAATKG